MNHSPAIAGVVITYFPDAEFEHRLDAIAREVKPLVVVDNSADEEVQARVRKACARCDAQLITNPVNRGLGAALNQAFMLLAQQRLTAVIAFDQDSTPV